MSSPLSFVAKARAEAAKELLIRRRARADVLDYCNAIDIPGKPATDDPDTEFFKPIESTMALHHRLIMQALEKTSKTPFGRLMLFMPPGSAKSTYASVVYPSRYLGEEANRRLILASYGDDLAKKMGRRTRSVIKQPRYRGIYNAELTRDSNAVNQFALTNGSEYMATGLLGGITGNRAGGVIIDDPIKGREQADSPTIRQKTYDAYEDDLKTRLIPGGWICLIQTRWHEDDLAGRILPEDWAGQSGDILCRDGNIWRVISLQARCELPNDPLNRQVGEYLWPEWFNEKHWAQFERNPRTWASLFQQLPRSIEGTLFQEESLLIFGHPHPDPTQVDYVYAVIDTAFKGGDKNDGTAVTFFARNRFAGVPLLVVDWDIVKIDGALLEDWVPGIIRQLDHLAKALGARLGSGGLYIEDKAAGTILLQKAAVKGWAAQAIDSKLVELGKDSRGLGVSDYVARGDVKITESAYRKKKAYNDREQNHFISQVTGYRLGLPNQADDLYDTFCYGISIGIGTEDGY
jgi:hypothetical protein